MTKTKIESSLKIESETKIIVYGKATTEDLNNLPFGVETIIVLKLIEKCVLNLPSSVKNLYINYTINGTSHLKVPFGCEIVTGNFYNAQIWEDGEEDGYGNINGFWWTTKNKFISEKDFVNEKIVLFRHTKNYNKYLISQGVKSLGAKYLAKSLKFIKTKDELSFYMECQQP
jgi:hypothetical protein